MTIHEAQQQLLFQLYHIYDNREAANIADLIMENITGWTKIDRIINKTVPLTTDHLSRLEKYTSELLAHTPVQYVLHEGWFAGMPFYVDANVLIPRPETEELVSWIVEDKGRFSECTVLDIGTGSGCIPIALKKKIPAAEVYACDISEGALRVAKRNAAAQNAAIKLIQADILDPDNWKQFPLADIIVSNPPYVPDSDKTDMPENVLNYEPHLALFTGNDDPLRFYKAIGNMAREQLKQGGNVYAEIHEDMADKVRELFLSLGFTEMIVRKDMQGKDRMIRVDR